jgi:type VI secretion system secreted protein VgrG
MDVRGSSAAGSATTVYECSADCIDLNNPFRPARVTPKPRIPGPQSHRRGPQQRQESPHRPVGPRLREVPLVPPAREKDKDISAGSVPRTRGANWGSMFVPHIGQEVIVSLRGGSGSAGGDRAVYNGNNKTPLDLPANADKSIIRDHKSNAITFDATDGDEKVRLQSR